MASKISFRAVVGPGRHHPGRQLDYIWYGSFGNASGRCALVRDEDSPGAYDLACSLWVPRPAPRRSWNATRFAGSIEPPNAAGKQQMGAGQARNRVKYEFERTVLFATLIQPW